MSWLKKRKRNKRNEQAYRYLVTLVNEQEQYDDCLLYGDWLMADFHWEQSQRLLAEVHAFVRTHEKSPYHD